MRYILIKLLWVGGERERIRRKRKRRGVFTKPVMENTTVSAIPSCPLITVRSNPSLYHPHQPIFYFFYWSLTLIIIRANIY